MKTLQLIFILLTISALSFGQKYTPINQPYQFNKDVRFKSTTKVGTPASDSAIANKKYVVDQNALQLNKADSVTASKVFAATAYYFPRMDNDSLKFVNSKFSESSNGVMIKNALDAAPASPTATGT